MKSETRNGVTVEVVDEHDGIKLDRWIIKRICMPGLPDIKPRDHSFNTAEEAIAYGVMLAEGAK